MGTVEVMCILDLLDSVAAEKATEKLLTRFTLVHCRPRPGRQNSSLLVQVATMCGYV
jgi:hypothetical protein